ncbi:MAG: hypothetical protein PHR43_07735 [Dehalococcoidales bacterium]|nr:hypothetical protein [Dehalococcoidales bacterium]
MAYGGGGAAVAAAAAIAQAIKASGAIVTVAPQDFLTILSKVEKPLVVMAKAGMFKSHYEYLSSYKGLLFFTKSETDLMLPGGTETVFAKKIWVPNL